MRKNHMTRGGHGVASGGVVAIFAGLFLVILCTANTVPAQLPGEGEFVERCSFSVALDGDIARVGGQREDLFGVSADRFKRHAVTGEWQLQDGREDVLGPVSTGVPFSSPISISGEYAMVGMEWEDGFKGAAYVLRRVGDRWVAHQKLTPSGGDGGYSHFGGSVAVSGEYAVVGATWEDGFRGSVYVFNRRGDEWFEEQKLVAEDARPDDRFGSSVAIDEEVLLIEAKGAKVHSVDSRGTYTFRRVGGAWVESESRPVVEDALSAPMVRPNTLDGILDALVDQYAAKPMVMLDALIEPPATMSATDGQFEDRVEIRWSSVSLDAVLYKILRDGELLSVAASDDSVYADLTAVPGVEYDYCVVVTDMTGADSQPVCDTGRCILFPAESVAASDGRFGDYVELTWIDRSQTEAGYLIKRDGVQIGATEANTEIFQDSDAVPDVTYQYEVLAFDAEGNVSEPASDDGVRGFILPPLSVSASDGQYPHRVVITWTDQAVGEQGYTIHRDDVLLATLQADAQWYEDATPDSGVTYEYCVTTLAAQDAKSLSVCDEGGIGILPAPADVSATDATFDDRIGIGWTDPSDLEDGYFIFRDGAAYDTTAANATSYSDFDAEPDSTYTYCVRAFSDSGGVSVDGCDEGFRSIVLAPDWVQATDGDFESHVEITWESASTTAALFKIYRDDMLIKTARPDSRSYSDFGGTAGADYAYCVTGVTALEDESARTCDPGRRTLLAPSVVQASDESFEDRVLISWTDNSKVESGYHVYRRVSTEADSVLIGTRETNRTSFIDETTVPGVTYMYSVAAFDTLGEALGQSVVETDAGRRALLPPTDVQATDGAFENQVEITWEDNSRVESGYRIYRDAVEVGTTADNAMSFVDGTVAFGVHYDYGVVAFDGYGESVGASDPGYAAILAPLSFNASDTYEDEVVLTWIDASEIEQGYRIYRDGVKIDSTGADAISYTDATAAIGVAYDYCAQSFSGAAESGQVCDTGIRFESMPFTGLPAGPAIDLDAGAKLMASDGAGGDIFGHSVAISGDYAIVGAPMDHPNGSAYIFRRSGSTWTEQAKLTASDGEEGDNFGISVAIDGEYAIVGANRDDDGNFAWDWDFGSAYIFRRSGSAWTEQVKLTAPDGAYMDHFGHSVAISEDYAIVGAIHDDDDYRGDDAGSAWIFGRSGSAWSPQTKIRAPDGAESDLFGISVAISGDYAIVGAHYDDDKGGDSGSAYIFRRSGSAWSPQAKLTAGDGSGMDFFGFSVAIDGGYAIVGAWGDDDQGVDSGSAYIFWRSGSAWSQQEKLMASDGVLWVGFGYSVAISGECAIVGAYHDDDKGWDSGSAYIFRRNGAYWNEGAKFTAGEIGVGSQNNFGCSVAISGGVAIAGALGDDEIAGESGAAYMFEALVAIPDAVTASDGTFDNRIQVKWKDRSDIEGGYRIYRDGALIEEVAPNVQSFNDYEAQPGRAYEYGVAAFSEQLGESDRVYEFGRRPPDGNITGRVATRVGAGVGGVSVFLDPAPNKALLFDGVGGHVRIEDAAIPSTAFTIELWMKSSDAENEGAPFSYAVGSNDNAILLYDYRDFQILVNRVTTGATGTSANDGEWHHLAFSWRSSDGQVKLYKDGQLEHTSTGVATGASIPAGGVCILGQEQDALGGGFQEHQAFRGQMDEVRIWNTVRSAEQIQGAMSGPLSGDEEGLLGYWPLDEGVGAVVADLTESPRYGTLGGGIYWTGTGAPLDVFATSDLEGNYALAKVHYGSSTTFKVKPSLGVRRFEPSFKTITLSTGNPVQNEVGFTDISSFTVSGFVKFKDTDCVVPNAEILVDDTMMGTTDKNGKYGVAVGIGEHVIEPKFGDHTFDPPKNTLHVEGDVSGVNFLNTKLRTLTGRVGGGCGLFIGTGKIEIRSENQCLIKEIQTGGDYEVLLPPQKYSVRMSDVDVSAGLDKADVLKFFDHLGTREINLTEADTTLDFIYRAPLKVSITGFPDPPCDALTLPDGTVVPAVPILAQGDWVALNIEVYEDYGETGLCPVDTGKVTLYDEIIDEEDTPVELAIKDGMARYQTAGNTPNITSGRKDAKGNDRSFQKALSAVVEVEGLAPKTQIAWVIVTGHRPRTASFTAKSQGIPLLILRDPPGDGSFSFVEEGTSFCRTISNMGSESASFGIKTKIKAGIRFSKGCPFWSSETEVAQETENKFLIGVEATQAGGLQICATTTERFSTSSSNLFIGRDGDVYLGIALNLIFAKTDMLDVESGRVEQSVGVALGGNGFETTYLFSDAHIRNTVIPQLEELSVLMPDSAVVYSAAAENWRAHLALNDSLKTAATLKENRSFSAGANYDFSQTSDTTSTDSWSVKVFTSNELALGFRFNESGSGVSSQFLMNLAFSYTRSETEMTKSTRKIGYTFRDDDLGDFFTVDVKDDPSYGTPVFTLRSGTSSCPWEPGTQPRDGVALTITPPARLDVSPSGAATFTMGLSNLSQSDEAREYILRGIQTSNPGGALIKANNYGIAGGLPFFIDPGQTQEVTLTVHRGPNRYNYENLAVMLVPPCEYANWRNGAPLVIADTVFFDVQFEAPCSDITLFRPLSGWAFNRQGQDEGNVLELILDGFRLKISEEATIEYVGAEYRRRDTDVWFPVPGATFMKDALEEGRSVTVPWDLSAVQDGEYELRAFTKCEAGKGFSGIAAGRIDRQPPEVFGTPQPSDGILSFGEDISISFNEPIACGSLRADKVSLRFADTGETIGTKTTCDGRTVVLTPLALADSLENRPVTAHVEGVQDLLGNPMAGSAQWTFTVRRTRFAWSQTSVTKEVAFRAPEHFEAGLVNGSPQKASFTLSAPSWLIPDVSVGALSPDGGTQSIRFTVQEDLAIGDYSGMVQADAGEAGVARLEVHLTVTCVPPDWRVEPSDFLRTMILTAEVFIEGEPSTDSTDVVAAFVGSQVRGVAPVELDEELGRYVVFLTLYSNFESGETVRFRVWDHSQCLMYNATEEVFAFAANGILGSPTEPVALHATQRASATVQAIALSAGWTGFSTHLLSEDMTPAAILSNLSPSGGDVIKSSDTFSQFDPGVGWVGSLIELDNVSSYMIRLSEAGTLVLDGAPVDPALTSIPVVDGWNWVGYLPPVILEPNAALAGLTPTIGDVIKSQLAFAYYDEGEGGVKGWFGSLQFMEPGQGYKLSVQDAARTSHAFTYPASSSGKRAPLVIRSKPAGDAPLRSTKGVSDDADWSVAPNAYQYNMTMTAIVRIDDVESKDEQDWMAAFVDGECRGVARPMYIPELDRCVSFLMIHSNASAGEVVRFRLFDADREAVLNVDEIVMFNVDAVYGSVDQPAVFSAVSPDGGLPTVYRLVQNYPNPFNAHTVIRFDLLEAGHVTLAIYNTAGQLVRTLVSDDMPAGYHRVSWDAKDNDGARVATGLYLYRLRAGDFVAHKKMVLMK